MYAVIHGMCTTGETLVVVLALRALLMKNLSSPYSLVVVSYFTEEFIHLESLV